MKQIRDIRGEDTAGSKGTKDLLLFLNAGRKKQHPKAAPSLVHRAHRMDEEQSGICPDLVRKVWNMPRSSS